MFGGASLALIHFRFNLYLRSHKHKSISEKLNSNLEMLVLWLIGKR
jgi:hypothetical protein